MIGRKHTDIYIAACGEHFDTGNAGRAHERVCAKCRGAMAGDPNDVIDELRADNAALLEACQHVYQMIEVELYESPADDQWHIAAAKLRDAINKVSIT